MKLRTVVLGLLLASSVGVVLPSVAAGAAATGVRPPLPASVPAADASWLSWLNYFRAQAGSPPVTENTTTTADAVKHAKYLANNPNPGGSESAILAWAHDEDLSKPFATPEGKAVARRSNVLGPWGSYSAKDARYVIEGWMHAPLHRDAMLDPAVTSAGLGLFCQPRDQYNSTCMFALGLDRGGVAASGVMVFPGPDTSTWLRRFDGEVPDPVADACDPTFPHSTGEAISILGAAVTTVLVTTNGGFRVPTCIVKDLLRSKETLAFPRYHLIDGTYEVQAETSDAGSLKWSFTVVDDPHPQGPAGAAIYAGADRIETALRAAESMSSNVIIARADQYADALAAVPLALARNALVVLTGSQHLDPRVADTLRSWKANTFLQEGTTYLLGGTGALSADVERELGAVRRQVVRIGGANRFETAAAIAAVVGNEETVLLADGGTFASAMVAGPVARTVGGAVLLLTDGSQLPQATRDFLGQHPSAKVIAIGSAAAAAVKADVSVVAPSDSELSLMVASRFFTSPPMAAIATSRAFADGLTAGAMAVREGGPLLLTDSPTFSPAITAFVLGLGCAGTSVDAFGGSTVIDQRAIPLLWAAMRAKCA